MSAKMLKRAVRSRHNLDDIYPGRGAAATTDDVAAISPPQKYRLAVRLDQFAGNQPQNPRTPLRIAHNDERTFLQIHFANMFVDLAHRRSHQTLACIIDPVE